MTVCSSVFAQWEIRDPASLPANELMKSKVIVNPKIQPKCFFRLSLYRMNTQRLVLVCHRYIIEINDILQEIYQCLID